LEDTVFIVNPRAASGRAERVWHQLRDQVAAVRRARCVDAADPEEARRQLLELLDERVRRVIAVGGDGTVNHAANVVLDSGMAAALGLVPVGSGSDTARGLSMQREPQLALERALGVTPRPYDVLRMEQTDGTGRWVVNIGSVGLSGLVAAEVNRLPKRWAGTYLWTALKVLSRFRASRARILLDDELWYEGGLILLAVANGSAFARGMRIAPHARSDDGLADVVLVKDAPLLQVLPYVPRLYAGTHLRAPFVQWARASRVRVEPVDELPPFETDGEPLSGAGSEFRVVPGALRVLY
jgi:diacylglycerol kinase (ATP)